MSRLTRIISLKGKAAKVDGHHCKTANLTAKVKFGIATALADRRHNTNGTGCQLEHVEVRTAVFGSDRVRRTSSTVRLLSATATSNNKL
ncbi:hypothetical protein F441_15366 [Phytophthora nicotianae CJ01A1]|uniref:Uncharacterized protein n=4 Tax=Phytophthora nicotianae TaxID=4792 RepID=W2R1I2_PHYN3|nr:hypothetical protein PPTG_21433 [Phytophthora nicotianae INRA-310]ETI38789.1 hypothetical protein F443_15544 [Phytophthora nicotianae P1569]ETN19213.1 hypothetical protein PPTG_21433 [Phytophthora nicotianae INRA-310]ETO67539.1 hypothetical protein F444_15538 [Phytophthora nicotianae P1976]ETP08691.1 hypothetical protein F441_15366 [Phytophthora nicotianae CJ01A1]